MLFRWRIVESNKLLLSGEFTTTYFGASEVVFPAAFHPQYFDWRRAPIAHFCGEMDTLMKLEFMFGVFAMRFYGDAAPYIIDLMEI